VEVYVTKKENGKASRSPDKLSTLDDFLREEGTLVEFETVATKEVLARRDLTATKPI
jgi:hypothetical protein